MKCKVCGVGISYGEYCSKCYWILQTELSKLLRDQFAMAALTGILAHHGCNFSPTSIDCARAYDYADAMLEARKQVRE